MDEPDRRTFLKKFRRPILENMQRQSLSKAVNTMARKVVYCPYCSATNGAVKKAGALKIIHDKFRAKKTADELEKFKQSFASAVESQKELGMYINKAVHEDLNPLKVLDLFRRISDEVCLLYDFWQNTQWLSKGLWTTGFTSRVGKAWRIHLAIHFSSSCMYQTIRCTGWRVEWRRSHSEAHWNRFHKCLDKTRVG